MRFDITEMLVISVELLLETNGRKIRYVETKILPLVIWVQQMPRTEFGPHGISCAFIKIKNTTLLSSNVQQGSHYPTVSCSTLEFGVEYDQFGDFKNNNNALFSEHSRKPCLRNMSNMFPCHHHLEKVIQPVS